MTESTAPESFTQGPTDVELLEQTLAQNLDDTCLLYTSPSPRDLSTSRMPSSA